MASKLLTEKSILPLDARDVALDLPLKNMHCFEHSLCWVLAVH